MLQACGVWDWVAGAADMQLQGGGEFERVGYVNNEYTGAWCMVHGAAHAVSVLCRVVCAGAADVHV